MNAGTTQRPRRSTTRVSGPASRRTAASPPTATNFPPWMATASAMEKAGSTVTTLPLWRIMSGASAIAVAMRSVSSQAGVHGIPQGVPQGIEGEGGRQRGTHDDRGHGLRQHVPGKYDGLRRAEGPRGLRVLQLPHPQHLAPYHSGHLHPAGRPEHEDDGGRRRSE